ncbi:hypothetical protein NK8_62040 (plasmid) [Caballeronia sp. NK8]|uniref:hypothetical protein n=1 Tax=Caballeronia sp. NK8 TaxID=140098 RepID=UPI001BB5D9B5|nr:hypothetical protein [Caballeronia sp. NK8]BCQ28015.1 hypothetical protein NK8_62040 [Caballeronia sp. NK8]
MLSAFENRKNCLIFQCAQKLLRIGLLLQSRISNDFTEARVESRVSIKKDKTWLNVYIGNGDEDEVGLFENDLINVDVTDFSINIDCTIYSNYGIDRVFSKNDMLNQFDFEIFDLLGEKIYSAMKLHIEYLI